MGRASPQETGARIETLLDELGDSADPSVGQRADELVRLLAQMYGEGLDRVVTVLRGSGPAGQRAVDLLADDALIGSLLALHGLHPVDVPTRVGRALDTVRPYLGSHAGGVELLGVGEDGVVRLRLQGSCDGCSASALTVQMAIETAILDAAPEVTAIDVEGVAAERQQGLLQIQPSPYRAVHPPPDGEDCPALEGAVPGRAGEVW
ncbi:MAG: NifU family protein [Actinomycetes bacterium]